MAHVPENPKQYICSNCHAVYVGTVVEEISRDNHKYEPPDVCAACESRDFTPLLGYPDEEDEFKV